MIGTMSIDKQRLVYYIVKNRKWLSDGEDMGVDSFVTWAKQVRNRQMYAIAKEIYEEYPKTTPDVFKKFLSIVKTSMYTQKYNWAMESAVLAYVDKDVRKLTEKEVKRRLLLEVV